MNLVLYGMDRELLPRLAAKLPPTTTLHWQDSSAPTSALDLQRGPQSLVLLDFRPEHAAASSVLAQQLQQTEPDLALVAVGATSTGQVEGIVIALRAGLRDVLDLDSDNVGIEAALRRALSPRPAAAAQHAHKARLIDECAACGKQHSLLAGTLFEQTKTGLAKWFLAIYLVTSSKGGISAMELQRQMGFGSYQTAWSWLHKIRKAMVRPEREPLAARVEADETYVGGPRSGRSGRLRFRLMTTPAHYETRIAPAFGEQLRELL